MATHLTSNAVQQTASVTFDGKGPSMSVAASCDRIEDFLAVALAEHGRQAVEAFFAKDPGSVAIIRRILNEEAVPLKGSRLLSPATRDHLAKRKKTP